MKVAIYVRTSKRDQHPENQVLELEKYAAGRGFEVYFTYVEQASGAKDSRPALNALMEDARLRKFESVLVWKLDRLGRSLQHLIQTVQEWNNLGINFICSSQSIDTTTNEGKLIFHIFGAIAEFERGLIQERIYLGLDRARAQGKHVGRPKGKKDGKRRRRSGYYLRWGKKSSPLKNTISTQEVTEENAK